MLRVIADRETVIFGLKKNTNEFVLKRFKIKNNWVSPVYISHSCLYQHTFRNNQFP